MGVNACEHPVFSIPFRYSAAGQSAGISRGYMAFRHAPIERQQPRRAAGGRHRLLRASGMPGSKRLSLPGDGADPHDVEATAILT
jgi:hypothetical protein